MKNKNIIVIIVNLAIIACILTICYMTIHNLNKHKIVEIDYTNDVEVVPPSPEEVDTIALNDVILGAEVPDTWEVEYLNEEQNMRIHNNVQYFVNSDNKIYCIQFFTSKTSDDKFTTSLDNTYITMHGKQGTSEKTLTDILGDFIETSDSCEDIEYTDDKMSIHATKIDDFINVIIYSNEIDGGIINDTECIDEELEVIEQGLNTDSNEIEE